MTDAARLEHECVVYTRYLSGQAADDTVCRHYADAVLTVDGLAARTRFDRLLGVLARTHPVVTRAVDVYARLFARASAVHRRLVMLLAILESRADTVAPFEEPAHAGPAGFVLDMAWQALVSLVLLLAAIALLLPLQLLFNRTTA